VRSLPARALLKAVEGEVVCGQRTRGGRRPCASNLPDAHALIKSPAVVPAAAQCPGLVDTSADRLTQCTAAYCRQIVKIRDHKELVASSEHMQSLQLIRQHAGLKR